MLFYLTVILLVLRHVVSFEKIILAMISVLIQLCSAISSRIHKSACSANPISGCSCSLETSDLICGFYWPTDFPAVGMSTDMVFEQTILCHCVLACHFLSHFPFHFFLGLSMIILKQLIYLKSSFSTQYCSFSMSRGLFNFSCLDLGQILNDVISWSIRSFLNITLVIGKFFIFIGVG